MSTFDVYVANEQVSEPVSATPIAEPSGMVQLINKMSNGIDITLQDGTNVRIGPKVRGLSINKSRPILKKLIPAYVNTLISKGELKRIDC